jgi:hypothetical protein
MTIEVTKPELEQLILQRLRQGVFHDVEELILDALRSSAMEKDRQAAIDRLRTFGQRHHLSLGNSTIHELRREARP